MRSFWYLFLFLIVGCSTHDSYFSENQIFRYNESKGIATLDPAFARNLPLIWPVHQIFNGLVQLDDSLNVIPCIAKAWVVSPDGKQYTFILRNDVSFHKSDVFVNQTRNVVASDFTYSFQRIQSPKTASPGSWVFSMVDTSFGESGFKAINDSIFQVKLKSPFPAFLGLLTTPYCSVVPFEAVEHFGKDFRSNVVGTGPYYLKLWREGEKLVLRRNPGYFEFDSNGNRLPYLEAVNVSFIADKQSEFLEFIKGNIDFISGVHPASKDELLTRTGELNPKYLGKIQMLTGSYLNTEYLGIQIDSTLELVKDSPLRNILVRKAIGYGIDRAKMMTHLRSNLGFPACKGFVPPGMPGYISVNNGFKYDPELASTLLNEAGYPEGKNIPAFTIATTDDYVDIFEFIQHQLSNLGLKCNVEVFPGVAYREMMANSKLQAFRGSWVADYADPENYLSLFYSENFSPSGSNYTHFKNMIYDKYYEQSISMLDAKNRNKLYNKMDSLVIDNAVVIPLYYDKVVRFVSINVDGLTTNPMNLLELKTVKKTHR